MQIVAFISGLFWPERPRRELGAFPGDRGRFMLEWGLNQRPALPGPSN